MKGKTVAISKGSLKGQTAVIEDLWINVYGKSWMYSDGNLAALKYAMRSAFDGLPIDDKVWYGKIDNIGYLIHESEIAE